MKKVYLLILICSLFATAGIGQNVTMSGTTINGQCSGNFYDPGGTGNYGNNLNVTQTFYPSAGNVMSFNFTAFRTTNANDYLIIYNGNSTAAPVLGIYSGNEGGFGIVHSTAVDGSLTFRFVSDNSTGTNNTGWTAAYSCVAPYINISDDDQTTCSSAFYDPGGVSGNYSNNQNFTQTISPATAGNKLRVVFSSFSLEVGGSPTPYDYLQIYDGNSTAAPLIGRYSGTTSPGTITSTAADGSLTFRFFSDAGVVSSGWVASLSCIVLNSIATGAITGSPFCVTGSASAAVSVPYSTTGTFAGGTTFTAQLSDATGGFTAPINIGTGASPISATIPAGTATGAGYRIRVISSTGVNGSNNGTNLAINLAANSIAPAATQNIVAGVNGGNLTVTEQSTPSSRTWFYGTTPGGPYPTNTGVTNTTFPPNFPGPGTYYVVCVSNFACGTITSNEVRFNVTDSYRSQFISANTGATTWCAGETRDITVTVKNIGTATWTNSGPVMNIGAKWNEDADYGGAPNNIPRVSVESGVPSGPVAPGATVTYTFPNVTASTVSPNNLTFDVVKEGDCWFGNNNGTCGPGNTVLTTSAITINRPTVNAGTALATICQASPSAALGGSVGGTATGGVWTDGGVGGTFSSGNINTATWTPPVGYSGTATLTLTTTGGSCGTTSASKTIQVNPTPSAIDAVADQVVCRGSNTAAITFSGSSPITSYTWTNTTTSIGLAASGTGNIASFTAINTGTAPVIATITVTPNYISGGKTCSGTPDVFTITVNPAIIVSNGTTAQTVCNGGSTAAMNFTTNATGAGTVTYNWTNNNTSVGLAASGTGNIASFSAINNGTSPAVANITVTPTYTFGSVTCAGTPKVFTLTVNPTATVNAISDKIFCRGTASGAINFSTPTTGGTVNYAWTNNNTAIGLAASGTGTSIATFNTTNTGTAPITATITVTPTFVSGVSCTGTPEVFTITVNPTVTISNATVTQTVCNGAPTTAVNFTTAATGGTVTYNWTNNTPSIGLAASGSGDIASFNAVNNGTAPVTATIAVTPTFTNGAVSCAGTPRNFTIVVNPTVTVNAITDKTLCHNTTQAAITFSSPTSSGVTYTWTNNTPSIGLAASGTGNIASFTGTNTTLNPVTATITVTPTYTGTVTCAGTPRTFTITVLPTPQVTISGAAVVCQNSAAPLITFTNPMGLAINVNYRINAGGNILLAVPANSSVTVAAPTTAAGTFNYQLVNVAYASATTCQVSVSGTALITVRPTPAPTVSGNTTVCQDAASPNITFTNPQALPVTITYDINGAGAFTVNVNGNSTATVPQVTGTAGTFAYTITSVAYQSGTDCTTPITGQTATVTVRPTPTATISGTTDVCQGTASPSITFTNPMALAITITYNINGAGSTNINVPANSFTTVAAPTATPGTFNYNITSVKYQSAPDCPNTFTTTATVIVNALPTAAISGTAAACQNDASPFVTFTGANGIAPYTFSYRINGGTVQTVSTVSGNSVTVAAPTGTTGVFTYTLVSVQDASSTTCSQNQAGTVTISVFEPVVITAQPDASQTTCATFPVNFTVQATGDGLTYQWYKDGSPLTDNANISGSLTNELNIAQAGTADAGTYTVTISGYSPCSPVTSANAVLIVNQEIVINNQPQLQSVCAGTTAVFTIDATGTGIIYQWRKGNTPLVDGGNISGVNTATLTITNVSAADVANNYNVVLTSPGGLCPQSNSTNVALVVNPIPDVVATPAGQPLCSGGTTSIALTSAVSGTTFSWTVVQSGVTGASDASGNNIAQTLTATGNVPGSVVYSITPSANTCSGTPITVTVTVNPIPDVVATPTSDIICSGTAPSINLSGTVAGTTYSWTVVQSGVSGASNSSGSSIAQTLTATGVTSGTATYTITPSANGCNGTPVVVIITVRPIPTVTATPSSRIICSGGNTSIALSGTVAATTYNWTVVQTGVSGAADGSGNTISQTLTTTGTVAGTAVYTVTPTANGCSGTPITITINVNPVSVITATPSSAIICSGATTAITLAGNVGGTVINWTVVQSGVTGASAGSGTSIAQTLTTTGTATGTATYTINGSVNGCPSTPVTVVVTVNPLPVITPLTQSVCNNAAITTITLAGSVPGTITGWTRDNPAGITSAIPLTGSGPISGSFTNANPIPTLVTFTVNATAGNGCPITRTVTVLVDAALTAPTISATQILCSGSSASALYINSGTGTGSNWTYQWTYSTTGGAPWIPIGGATGATYNPPTQTRYYQLIVSNSCGSVTTNIIQISTADDFGLSFTGDAPPSALCDGDNFNYEITALSFGSLDGGRTIRYIWNSPTTGAFTSSTANPFGTTSSFFGIYYYTGNANFVAHNNTNAPVTRVLTVTPVIYNSDGSPYCNLTPKTYSITINPIPVIGDQSATVCSGASFNVSPVNGVPSGTIVPTNVRYSWSAPVAPGITGLAAGTSQTTISGTLTNTTNAAINVVYVVTPFINGGTCPGAAFNVTVTVNAKPVIPTQNVTACSGAAFTVTPVNGAPTAATIVPSGTTYNWNAPTGTGFTGGSAGSGTSITGTLSTVSATPVTATYLVTPTSGAAGSCPGTAFNVVVTVNPTPTASIAAAAATVCSGTATTINFTGTPNTIVTYTINSGSPLTITLNGAGTNSVSTGPITGTVTYTLVNVAFSGNVCPRSLSATAVVNVNPVATASISSTPGALCQGQTGTVTFTGTPNTIVTYNTGGANTTITLNGAGTATITGAVNATITYNLVSVAYTGTPACPQSISGSTTITVNPNANAGTVSGTSPLCIGATVTYTSNGDAGGTWSSSNPTVASVNSAGLVTALTAGTSNIIYIVSSGCNSPVSASRQVTVSPNANAGTVTGISPICVGAQTLYSSNGNAGGTWSSSDPSIATVTAGGVVKGIGVGFANIIYTVNSGCNAPASSMQQVQVLNPAPASAPGAISGSIELCGATAGLVYSVAPVANASTYVWTLPSGWNITAGNNTNSITVTSGATSGTISVTAGNSCGFSAASTLPVTVTPAGQWRGYTSNWHDAGNWCAGIPTVATNVIIPVMAPGRFYPIISAPATANNITTAAGATITLNNSNLDVYGSITSTNGIDAANGHITFKGGSLQNVSGSMFAAKQIRDITIDNNVNVTGADTLKISGTLDFGSPTGGRTFAAGSNNVVLLSSLNRTANVPDIGNNNITGSKFTVERFINTGTPSGANPLAHGRKWQLLSVPTNSAQTINNAWQEGQGANINNLPGYGTLLNGPSAQGGYDANSAGTYIKYYLPNVDQWSLGSNPTTTGIATNRGWMTFVLGDRGSTATVAAPTVLRTTGSLFTGTQPAIGIQANKYDVIGNPYPSEIDLRQLILPGSNLTEDVYVWDPSLGDGFGFGRYVTLTRIGANYEAVPPTAMYPGISNMIQSGQAFFVKSNGVAASSVTFTEAAKSNSSKVFTRGANGANETMRINLSIGAANATKTLLDGAIAVFDDQYLPAVDRFDGLKLINSGENAGFKTAGKALAVDRRPSPVSADTLYVEMTAMKVQPYSWEVIASNMDKPGRNAWLLDNFLGTKTALALEGSTIVNFDVTSAAASAASNRFSIVFSKLAAPLPVTITSISATRNSDRSIAVKWSVENELNIDRYEIERSADGSSFTGILTSASTNSRNYAKNDLSPLSKDNFYRIKATGINGQVQYSAIVKVAPIKTASSISVYPNPVEGKIVNLRFTDMAAGNYQLQLTNNLGQIVYSGTASVNAANFVKNITLSKLVTAGTYQLKVVDADGHAVDMQLTIQ